MVANYDEECLFQRFPFSIVSSRQLDYTFYPGVGYLTSPGVDISYKGALAYSVSSERHRQCGVNELGSSFEEPPEGFEPGTFRSTVLHSNH